MCKAWLKCHTFAVDEGGKWYLSINELLGARRGRDDDLRRSENPFWKREGKLGCTWGLETSAAPARNVTISMQDFKNTKRYKN
jgi:hypothetical protein